ncbi:cytochrome P450 [Lasiosphaeria ovina]|uniref:Cytochrome P450 n=1 Tax=Lasiosphaeria ovina TaxID=92902 RepID=A0AAE0N6Z0_9PEZI|nr:cytochrome P450 [Lasiosphaeria ovina]
MVQQPVSADESTWSLLPAVGDEWVSSTNRYIVATAVILFFLLSYISTPRLDPREPPLLKPALPLIGHIIGLIRHQAKYHVILYRRSRQSAVTLPMLTGKMYAVWDPTMITTGLRNKNLSTTPLLVSSTPPLTGVGKETMDIIRGSNGDCAMVDDILLKTGPAMAGAYLQQMNAAALSDIGDYLSQIDEASVPDLWMWIRRLMVLPTSRATFGHGDPFSKDPALEQLLFDFANDIPKLVLGFIPATIAAKGYYARAVLQKAFIKYYSSRQDEDSSTSGFVKVRAREFRGYGVRDDDIGRAEIMLPFAVMVNTFPALFWFFYHVMSRPNLVERIRKEVEGIASRTAEEATLDLTAVDKTCPLLVSCYRETLRLSNHQVSTRTVLKDTVLTDSKGKSYLLKEGTMVHFSICASLRNIEFWGEDVETFKPERFLRFGDKKDDVDPDRPGGPRAMRTAFIPFGGGQHLCPGRNFAFAEMIAVIATLTLGYDIEPENGTWELPTLATASIVDAITKPTTGKKLPLKIKRKREWKALRWRYRI